MIAATEGVAIGGAAIGTLVLPGIGTVIGGLIGEAFTTRLTHFLGKWIKHLFEQPKEQAVKKAFEFIGMEPNAPDHLISKVAKKLMRALHLNKNCNTEEAVKKWHQLQVSIATIKVSKRIQ